MPKISQKGNIHNFGSSSHKIMKAHSSFLQTKVCQGTSIFRSFFFMFTPTAKPKTSKKGKNRSKEGKLWHFLFQFHS